MTNRQTDIPNPCYNSNSDILLRHGLILIDITLHTLLTPFHKHPNTPALSHTYPPSGFSSHTLLNNFSPSPHKTSSSPMLSSPRPTKQPRYPWACSSTIPSPSIPRYESISCEGDSTRHTKAPSGWLGMPQNYSIILFFVTSTFISNLLF